MDIARWERIQSLFHAAADLDAAGQVAYLKAECGVDGALIAAVVALLDEDAASSSLLDGDMGVVASRLMAASPPGLESGRFGPYRIIRLLGEGGAGVVYLAGRDELNYEVAVKFLRDAWLSPDRRERFANEQRTLAQLNHPSIARLYEVGTLEDGTPWFVMEYVDGVQIGDFCAREACGIKASLLLVRAVCEAVSYAHDRGVIHRDLKPANILVRGDGTVKLLDFGIARHLDSAAEPDNRTRTGFRQMTPAYASPEQIRGEQVDTRSDVYSLGVILYQLVAGSLPFDVSTLTPGEALSLVVEHAPPRPSHAARRSGRRVPLLVGGSSADLDVLCLKAMHKDPRQRYQSVAALIQDIDHLLDGQPLDARPDAPMYVAVKFLSRNRKAMGVAALMLIAMSLAWKAGRQPQAPPAGSQGHSRRTVAVLPFQNAGTEPGLDFLRVALADEIATILSHTRSVSVRPFATTSRYSGSSVDLQQAGRQMRVATVVTGHFLRAAGGLRITLEALDVDNNRVLWHDALDAPADNLVAIQAQVALRVRGGLAARLGWTAADGIAHPRVEEAYGAFLRSTALTLDPDPNRNAIRMLERSVELDPSYPQAWHALARRYYVDTRYRTGDPSTFTRYDSALQKALALDPGYIAAGAALTISRVEQGKLVEAYQQARELVHRRPDSIDAHFALSYVLRFAGLLDESASECDTAFMLDPRAQPSGLRSCAVVFLLRGASARARNYIALDHGSNWAKALSIHLLVRDGKEADALALGSPAIPQWNSYELLFACLQRRPWPDIVALGESVTASGDPETNYFSAAHLAYCGQTSAALAMLRVAVGGRYCSYPAIDSDPYFASLRSLPGFAAIRSEAIACHEDFLARRDQPRPQPDGPTLSSRTSPR